MYVLEKTFQVLVVVLTDWAQRLRKTVFKQQEVKMILRAVL